MRLFTLTTALITTTLLPFTTAYWKGFNIGATNPDGSCKTQSDWTTAFQKLQSLPGHFTTVRLYASSDCSTLQRAVPAALATGTKLLVGVWAEETAHFEREKEALKTAIQNWGAEWIVAVSVGSEDLYRGDSDPQRLVERIKDVRGMVWGLGAYKEVGHVDTWTAW